MLICYLKVLGGSHPLPGGFRSLRTSHLLRGVVLGLSSDAGSFFWALPEAFRELSSAAGRV